jgi:hypothetical protein
VQVKSERERSMPCGASEEWRDKLARVEGPGSQQGQVRAAWWQEKQYEVVDRSRCRVAAHNRSLHAGFVVVHRKISRVTWLSHKTKTRGSAGGDGILARREASKRRTRIEIARLASRLSKVWSPGIRPIVLRQEYSQSAPRGRVS